MARKTWEEALFRQPGVPPLRLGLCCNENGGKQASVNKILVLLRQKSFRWEQEWILNDIRAGVENGF